MENNADNFKQSVKHESLDENHRSDVTMSDADADDSLHETAQYENNSSNRQQDDLPRTPQKGIPPWQPFKCDLCGTFIETMEDWRDHANIHRENFYPCAVCPKWFTCKAYLNRHEKAHTSPWPCDYCAKSFSHKHHLKEHLRTHSNESLKCPFCEFRTKYSQSLRRHSLRLHEDASIQCTGCGEVFLSVSELNVHEQSCNQALFSAKSQVLNIMQHMDGKTGNTFGTWLKSLTRSQANYPISDANHSDDSARRTSRDAGISDDDAGPQSADAKKRQYVRNAQLGEPTITQWCPKRVEFGRIIRTPVSCTEELLPVEVAIAASKTVVISGIDENTQILILKRPHRSKNEQDIVGSEDNIFYSTANVDLNDVSGTVDKDSYSASYDY